MDNSSYKRQRDEGRSEVGGKVEGIRIVSSKKGCDKITRPLLLRRQTYSLQIA